MEELNQDSTAEAKPARESQPCPAALAKAILTEAKEKVKAAFEQAAPLCSAGKDKYLLKPLQNLEGILANPNALGLGQAFQLEKGITAHQAAYDSLLEQLEAEAKALVDATEGKEDVLIGGYIQTAEFADKISNISAEPKAGSRGLFSDIKALIDAYRDSVQAHDPKAFITKARELFPIFDRLLKNKFFERMLRLSEKLSVWIDIYQKYLALAQEVKLPISVGYGVNVLTEKALIFLEADVKKKDEVAKQAVAEYAKVETVKAEQQAELQAELLKPKTVDNAVAANTETPKEENPAETSTEEPAKDTETPKVEKPAETSTEETDQDTETATDEQPAETPKTKKAPKK